jgi:hypothetical protein
VHAWIGCRLAAALVHGCTRPHTAHPSEGPTGQQCGGCSRPASTGMPEQSGITGALCHGCWTCARVPARTGAQPAVHVPEYRYSPSILSPGGACSVPNAQWALQQRATATRARLDAPTAQEGTQATHPPPCAEQGRPPTAPCAARQATQRPAKAGHPQPMHRVAGHMPGPHQRTVEDRRKGLEPPRSGWARGAGTAASVKQAAGPVILSGCWRGAGVRPRHRNPCMLTHSQCCAVPPPPAVHDLVTGPREQPARRGRPGRCWEPRGVVDPPPHRRARCPAQRPHLPEFKACAVPGLTGRTDAGPKAEKRWPFVRQTRLPGQPPLPPFRGGCAGRRVTRGLFWRGTRRTDRQVAQPLSS